MPDTYSSPTYTLGFALNSGYHFSFSKVNVGDPGRSDFGDYM
jgi:hypothetical protein